MAHKLFNIGLQYFAEQVTPAIATGVKAQVTAAPAADTNKSTFLTGNDVIGEIDDGDDGVVIVDDEPDESLGVADGSDSKATAETIKKSAVQEPDRNAIMADMRRKAESDARIKATAEAQRIAQAQIDEVFKGMNLRDPYTNKIISTKAEYDAYKEKHESEKIGSELSKAGISRESLDAMIASHPALKKAETAAKAYEDAKRHEQDIAAKTHFDNQLKEIGTLDPEIKTIEDLMAQPNYDVIHGYIRKGLTAVESYKLANIDKLSAKQSQAAAQSAYNKSVSKDHLTSTAVRGQGEIPMAKKQLEEYRRLTGKTDKEIRADYAKYVKTYQKPK